MDEGKIIPFPKQPQEYPDEPIGKLAKIFHIGADATGKSVRVNANPDEHVFTREEIVAAQLQAHIAGRISKILYAVGELSTEAREHFLLAREQFEGLLKEKGSDAILKQLLTSTPAQWREKPGTYAALAEISRRIIDAEE